MITQEWGLHCRLAREQSAPGLHAEDQLSKFGLDSPVAEPEARTWVQVVNGDGTPRTRSRGSGSGAGQQKREMTEVAKEMIPAFFN